MIAVAASDRDRLREWIRRFRVDPALFARKVLKIEPTEQQRRFLAELSQEGAHVAIRSGHGTGKSKCLAMAALWFFLLFKDAVVPCTAPTAHQLEDILWREIRQCVDGMEDWWRRQITVGADKVTGSGSAGMIVARTARPEKPDALQGFHARNILFIIDEAAGVHDTVFEVARGALSTPGAKVVMTGNPTRLTGYFHNAFHLARDTWTRLQFSCLDSPLVGPEYAREIAREYGEDSDMYRVRVLGDFPKAGIFNLISLELVERAMERKMPPDWQGHAAKIIGVDPAWMGTDRSAAVLRQGLSAKVLFATRGADTIRLAELVARRAADIGPDAVFVDQTGVGAGVFDQLKTTNLPVAGVSFAHSPLDGARFVNRRAEMWWLLKEWLEQGPVIEKNGDLRDDLIAPEYHLNGNGKIQLESKDDMRKRGLASPDLGDALALTFAMPVLPRRRPEPLSARRRGHQHGDWMERR